MKTPAGTRGRHVLAAVAVGLLAAEFVIGCVSRPVVTRTIYEDRSAWIRLEINPDADESAGTGDNDPAVPSAATLAALLKGFRAEKDYNPGLLSFAVGKTYFNRAFVDPELMVLTPHLSKALAQASPKERAAYCLAVDYLPDERFITTGWAYIIKPHLYFKLVEWRTPIHVKSPAVPTSEACLVKPIPGVKTSDRFFKLEYSPQTFIETFGPMGASIMNKRGEVVFKLTGLDVSKLSVPTERNGATASFPVASESSRPPQPAAAATPQPEHSREVSATPPGGKATRRVPDGR